MAQTAICGGGRGTILNEKIGFQLLLAKAVTTRTVRGRVYNQM